MDNLKYILVFLVLMVGSYYVSGLIVTGFERGLAWGFLHLGSFAIFQKYRNDKSFAKFMEERK